MRVYKNLFFIFKPNQLGYPRFIPILAKKKTKNAVQRNLIRRLVKEHMRHNLSNIKALDIIVLTNKKTASSDKEAFHQCLDKFIDTVKNWSLSPSLSWSNYINGWLAQYSVHAVVSTQPVLNMHSPHLKHSRCRVHYCLS